MEKRKLGDCPIELSCVGLGTFAMAGEGLKNSWGPQDDACLGSDDFESSGLRYQLD
jgi:hypothetical protein